jgi:hypothetical protein
MTLIQNFTQIKEIIEPIPADEFIAFRFGTPDGKSCFLGHIHRKLNPDNDPTNYLGDGDGYGAGVLTAKFLMEKHGIAYSNGATVNNSPGVNGYIEPEIKDRLMHMINDGIAAGY